MESLSPEQVQAILNVTAQSLAKHCGLVDDPEARSEEQRSADLSRQLGLLQRWPRREADVVYSEFAAKYLPPLVAQYETYATPYNIATVMLNALSHLPYFIRYQKMPAASGLVVSQAIRIADATYEPSDPQVVAEVCQFLSTLLVLQGTSAIPEDVKTKLVSKLSTWRHRYRGQFPGETSDRCYQSLQEHRGMIEMSRMVRDTLERPLNHCGFEGCDLGVDSVGPELKQCSRQVQISSILRSGTPKATLASAQKAVLSHNFLTYPDCLAMWQGSRTAMYNNLDY